MWSKECLAAKKGCSVLSVLRGQDEVFIVFIVSKRSCTEEIPFCWLLVQLLLGCQSKHLELLYIYLSVRNSIKSSNEFLMYVTLVALFVVPSIFVFFIEKCEILAVKNSSKYLFYFFSLECFNVWKCWSIYIQSY